MDAQSQWSASLFILTKKILFCGAKSKLKKIKTPLNNLNVFINETLNTKQKTTVSRKKNWNDYCMKNCTVSVMVKILQSKTSFRAVNHKDGLNNILKPLLRESGRNKRKFIKETKKISREKGQEKCLPDERDKLKEKPNSMAFLSNSRNWKFFSDYLKFFWGKSPQYLTHTVAVLKWWDYLLKCFYSFILLAIFALRRDVSNFYAYVFFHFRFFLSLSYFSLSYQVLIVLFARDIAVEWEDEKR